MHTTIQPTHHHEQNHSKKKLDDDDVMHAIYKKKHRLSPQQKNPPRFFSFSQNLMKFIFSSFKKHAVQNQSFKQFQLLCIKLIQKPGLRRGIFVIRHKHYFNDYVTHSSLKPTAHYLHIYQIYKAYMEDAY